MRSGRIACAFVLVVVSCAPEDSEPLARDPGGSGPKASEPPAAPVPPPISGGPLAVAPGGARAFVADPDRDRVMAVALPGGTTRC